jgi:group I intron endonuclease
VIVYALTNRRNNKVYIGQHKGHTLSKRWNNKLNNPHVNNHLSGAIKKYGATSFRRTIICHASCQQELDLLEQFWIAFYKATNPRYGYNIQTGGRIWHGECTKKLRQLISDRVRKAWAKKSAKEKWEYALSIKLRWLMRTERQRKRITAAMRKCTSKNYNPWNKGMKGQGAGRPSPKKGKKCGPQKHPCRHKKPFTEEHKANVSKGLKRYYRRRAKG